MIIKNNGAYKNTFINFKMSNFEFENVIDEKFRKDQFEDFKQYVYADDSVVVINYYVCKGICNSCI